MKPNRTTWTILTLLLALMLACGQVGGLPTESPAVAEDFTPPAPMITLRLTGSMKPLEPILLDSGVSMNITYYGDVELRLKIAEYEAASKAAKADGTVFHSDIDMFGTAGDMWMPGSYVRNRTRLPSTYVVMLVNKEFASKMGWQVGNLLPLEELDKAIENDARIGMTSASQDGAGALTMLAHLQSQKGTDGEPLQVADLDNPAITGPTDAFYDAVVENLGNIDLLVKREVRNRQEGRIETDLLFMPENTAVAFNQQLKDVGAEQMLVFYVNGLTTIQTFIMGCSSDIPDANTAECAKVLAHLNSPEAQAKMLSLGYRVTPVGMAVTNPDPAVFDPTLGFMADREFVATNPPKEDVFKLAQIRYQSELRPDSITGVCADHTGSMDENDGIGQLRTALKAYMLQDEENAIKHGLQATDGDIFFLMPFAGEVKHTYTIKGNDPVEYLNTYNDLVARFHPSGGTDIYRCTYEALFIVATNNDGSHLPAVIVISDGEQSPGGVSFEELAQWIADNDLHIPVYSIMLGKAVESELQALADLTNGEMCDGRGGEEALVRCFLRFKGNN